MDCDELTDSSVSSDDSSENTNAELFIWYIDSVEICVEIEEGVDTLIENCVVEYIDVFFKPWFYDAIIEIVATLTRDICAEAYDIHVRLSEMKAYIELRATEYFGTSVYPIRALSEYYAEDTTFADRSPYEKAIAAIAEIPCAAQRSLEWYETRHNMLTASSVGKLFGSDAERNSVILEKCMPLVVRGESGYPVNTRTPMHHGVKYEPVSAMLYCRIYGTQLGEFGCVPHPQRAYLGASPDGIVVNPESPLFGRMLEIKNIVNRDITGIPSPVYWAQVQFQLEVCGLDECDFVETRIREYASREECAASLVDTASEKKHTWKGVVLHFVDANDAAYRPIYAYMPLDPLFSMQSADAWIETEIAAKAAADPPLQLYDTQYWYCDEFSCSLIRKNAAWIAAAMPVVDETWRTIVAERESGYAHRRPKSRQADLQQLFAASEKHPKRGVLYEQRPDAEPRFREDAADPFSRGDFAVVKLN